MPSEAKQTKMVGGSCSKRPELPEGFQQGIFKGQVRDGCPRVCDQLLHNFLIG